MSKLTIEMADKAFPTRLAAARQAAGLSQSDLARRLNIERASVSAWERGRVSSMLGETLIACAKELRVSPEWLVTGAEDHTAELRTVMTNLTPEQTALVLTLARSLRGK